MATNKKGSWIVTAVCTVTKEYICEDCTESEARENPHKFTTDERETGISDWDVKSVKPNE